MCWPFGAWLLALCSHWAVAYDMVWPFGSGTLREIRTVLWAYECKDEDGAYAWRYTRKLDKLENVTNVEDVLFCKKTSFWGAYQCLDVQQGTKGPAVACFTAAHAEALAKREAYFVHLH